MPNFGIAHSEILKVLLELKGVSVKGFGMPQSHPWVPFIVDFAVMMMVYDIQNTCGRLMFCFGYGGGGRMTILSYNPWGFEKWLRLM